MSSAAKKDDGLILDWATDYAVAAAMKWLEQNPQPRPPQWEDFFPLLARRLCRYAAADASRLAYEDFCAIAKAAGVAAVQEAVEAEAKRCRPAQ